jgi:hypothetical protein
MQVFDRCFLFADGNALGMVTGGTLEGQGDPMVADTMLEEMAGVTPVPKHMILSFDNLVPPSGFELDIFKKWIETVEITFRLQFPGSNKTFTTTGFMDAPSLKFGAADQTVLTGKAKVKAVAFV